MATDDLRRVVLEASLALIEEEGLGALSMREVARRAGVSHQAPYHHFQDREGILAAIAMDGFTRLHVAMRRAAAKESDQVARLNAIGRAYVTFAARNPAHFKIMFRSELVTIERHDPLRVEADDAFAFVTEIVRQAVESSGERRVRDPLPFAIAAWSLVHGASTLLLEGKLEKHFGDSRAKRLKGAIAAVEVFGQLLRDEM
jgi:AcrR family transcriptional regulator